MKNNNLCSKCKYQSVNMYGNTFCPFIDEYCCDINETQMKSVEYCLINKEQGDNNG